MHAEATERKPAETSARWARFIALIYDAFLWSGELAGMRRRRKALLAEATGQVLEIGAGTGLNLPRYPDELERLVLVEPEPAMRKRLTRRLRHLGHAAEVVDAGAENLPFPDASFDTVVSTLVLCTVDDPGAALAEIGRVLRPDGRLLFIEHVRSDSRSLARLQDRLVEPWRRFACGCRCNRATAELMRACGFEVEATEASWQGMPPIVRPLLAGRASCRVPARQA